MLLRTQTPRVVNPRKPNVKRVEIKTDTKQETIIEKKVEELKTTENAEEKDKLLSTKSSKKVKNNLQENIDN